MQKLPTYEGPDGIRLYIDHEDHDTPAIVEVRGATATYDCAVSTGELDSSARVVFLSQAQLDWLGPFQDEVDEAFEIARKGMSQYE